MCRRREELWLIAQRVEPKTFPVFDCDSHIYEPPEIWDKYIPQNNRDFAKTHFYRDADRLFLVRNSRISFRDPDKWKYPGETWHPGLTKKIIGQTQPGTKDWDETIGRNKSARDPNARLKDMDASGIDQVMIFPSTFVYLPLVENADAAYICARAYNDWAYDYCSADKKRLLSRRRVANAECRFRHRRTAPGRQARLQIRFGAADHRPG